MIETVIERLRRWGAITYESRIILTGDELRALLRVVEAAKNCLREHARTDPRGEDQLLPVFEAHAKLQAALAELEKEAKA